jgi:FtsP/CotA-like multicopper oxidase with cupredoxin domain
MKALASTLAITLSLGGLALSGCAKKDQAAKDELTSAEAAVEHTLHIDGPEIVNPPTVASKDGVLEWTVTAAPARVTVAGETFVSNVYNGTHIPPVLRVHRGDEVRITYVNNIDKADIEID